MSRVSLNNGGENGIRTHERVSPLHAFQACAFNHSATSPHKFRQISHSNFAKILGISPVSLSRYINGERIPEKRIIEKIFRFGIAATC